MSWFTSLIGRALQGITPQVQPVRFRYHSEKIAKGLLLRRYGYKEKILTKGLLPHVDGKRIDTMPIYRPRDVWSEKRALFGQNDYIDILGDESIHPTKIAYNMQSWLRGFKGNEFRTILRKRKILMKGIIPVARPSKWNELNKRMDYLYRFLNRRTKTGFSSKA